MFSIYAAKADSGNFGRKSNGKAHFAIRFLPTEIVGIASGGSRIISVGQVRPKFVVPFLTNWFIAMQGIRKKS